MMILQYIIRFLSRVSLHRMQPWKLTTAEEPHSEEILTLVCEEFCSNSTLHKALGIGTEEYREAMTDGWHDYLFSGPVAPLLATGTDNEKILACIIPAPFPSNFKDFQTLPEIQQAIPALLAELETRYLQKHKPPEKSLLVDIAVVAADAANTGIYQQLRLALERNAADAGFDLKKYSVSCLPLPHNECAWRNLNISWLQKYPTSNLPIKVASLLHL